MLMNATPDTLKLSNMDRRMTRGEFMRPHSTVQTQNSVTITFQVSNYCLLFLQSGIAPRGEVDMRTSLLPAVREV